MGFDIRRNHHVHRISARGHRLSGENKVCEVLQSSRIDRYVQAGRGHSDGGYAEPPRAGGQLPQHRHETVRASEGDGSFPCGARREGAKRHG